MHLSALAAGMRPSLLRHLLARASAPGVISFAVGVPDGELFPREDLAAATAAVLASPPGGLQYGVPLPALKERLVELMSLRGLSCRPEQIFLCSGAQQGLKLLGELLLGPGSHVMVEEVAYDGMRIAVSAENPRLLSVPTDPWEGIDLDALEERLAAGARPAFLYLIPEGHNPLGCSLGLAERRRLIELADRFDLLIVEDDACGLLHYEPVAPTLYSMAPERVIYVGTLSKILAPALRVGWLVVPEALIAPLSMLKQAMDFDTSTFAQHLACAFLASGRMGDHLARLRDEYRLRRDLVLAALETNFGPNARWSRPRSGLYVWLELPGEIDSEPLLETALEVEKVAFCPGSIYVVDEVDRPRSTLRLSFGGVPADLVEEGVARIARAARRFEEERGKEAVVCIPSRNPSKS